MNNYTITIEETCSETFSIKAESPEEALELVKQGYKDCVYILEPGELVSATALIEGTEFVAYMV